MATPSVPKTPGRTPGEIAASFRAGVDQLAAFTADWRAGPPSQDLGRVADTLAILTHTLVARRRAMKEGQP